jgi:hypothetical protein
MVQLASCHEHRSAPKAREIVLDLVVNDGRGFGDHLQKQFAQFRDVPLTVPQLVEALPDCLIPIDLKCLKKGTVGALDAKALIQNQQRVGNRINDSLRLNVAIPHKTVQVFHIHHAPLADPARPMQTDNHVGRAYLRGFQID